MSFLTVLPLAQELQGVEAKAGYAVATSADGCIVDFFYFRKTLPDFAADGPGDGHWSLVVQATGDHRCSTEIERLQRRGQLHTGVMSPTGFIELKRWTPDNSNEGDGA